MRWRNQPICGWTFGHKEIVEETVIKDLDKNDTENEQVDKDKELVMSESMLDDILLEGY